MGKVISVDHDTAQRLTAAVGAEIEVAQQTFSCGFVVGGQMKMGGGISKNVPQFGHRLGLQHTILHVEDMMAAGAVVPHRQSGDSGFVRERGDRKLHLIAVTIGLLGPNDLGDGDGYTAHPAQSVLNPLALGQQLLGVGHVAELAPATFSGQRTIEIYTLRSGGEQFYTLTPGYVFVDLLQPHLPALTTDGVGDENHPAFQPGNAQAFGGIIQNVQLMDGIFLPLSHKQSTPFLCCFIYLCILA